MGRLLFIFALGVVKYSDKSNLSKEELISAHSSRSQAIRVEKSQHQELEADDGHGVPSQEERTTNSCVQLTFSLFYSSESHPREWCYPQWVGLPSINLIRIMLGRPLSYSFH